MQQSFLPSRRMCLRPFSRKATCLLYRPCFRKLWSHAFSRSSRYAKISCSCWSYLLYLMQHCAKTAISVRQKHIFNVNVSPSLTLYEGCNGPIALRFPPRTVIDVVKYEQECFRRSVQKCREGGVFVFPIPGRTWSISARFCGGQSWYFSWLFASAWESTFLQPCLSWGLMTAVSWEAIHQRPQLSYSSA